MEHVHHEICVKHFHAKPEKRKHGSLFFLDDEMFCESFRSCVDVEMLALTVIYFHIEFLSHE